MTIFKQRENPALPVSDERSDVLSEPRSEQGGSESRKLRKYAVIVPAGWIFNAESQLLSHYTIIGYV
jgi:hypothetical protein